MDKHWYVVRVQSGREDKVRDTLEKRVHANGLEEEIGRIIVPTERVSEFKGGKKRVREKKIFPGYLVVEMAMNDRTWYLIRETPGIGDFLQGSGVPSPMATYEVERILNSSASVADKPKLKIDFVKDDNVRIKEGPFENFEGPVEEVLAEQGRVKVVVTIFGRATPIELGYWQIEKT